MIARWQLAISADTAPHAATGMPHARGGGSCDAATDLPAAQESWSGEFVVASPDRGGRWLEIADVIGCPGLMAGENPGLPARLSWMLARFPGCGVAVTGVAGHGCLVCARDGTAAWIVSGPGVPGMLCGCLAHSWIVAGRRLAVLDGIRVRVRRLRHDRGWAAAGQLGGLSFSFGMRSEDAWPEPSASSRARSGSSLRAPMSW